MAQAQRLGGITMGQAVDALVRDGSVEFELIGLRNASDQAFAEFTYDSRAVVPDTLFACKGASFREEYLGDAIGRGATAYLAERPYAVDAPGLVVSDVRRAMAVLANEFFGYPSHRLPVVGITGTKGKTTTTFYLDAILKAAGKRPAMITGVVVDDGGARTVSHNTTPEAIELQRILARSAANGCTSVTMEASSQGLKYDRTYGVRFEAGVFTNIGEDHISPIEHPTFEDYLASKLRIFNQCRTAVVNLDTKRLEDVLKAADHAPDLLTYSLKDGRADVRLKGLEHRGEGRWGLDVIVPNGEFTAELPALGRFNVENALAAVAVAQALDIDGDAVAAGLTSVTVPGRMERYDAPDGSLVGIVDYAHNEMSMEAVLRCVREEFPGWEVTVVFGATGERATQRRLGLGRAAGRFADRIILTEDDPGRVPVAEICEAIGEGIVQVGGGYEVVEDRAQAVEYALSGAHRPAVVVLAGKGAEDSIQRACGTVPCKTDAALLCEGLGC